jgi:hypothetical protein
MTTIEADLYVLVQEMAGERAPQPRPLQSGFSVGVAYRILGLSTASETSEAYLVLANDRDELWFISNRHFRVHGIARGCTDIRFDVPATARAVTSR